MFATRFAAITAATLFSGVAIAAFTSINPFQMESPKVEQHKVVMQGAGVWEGTLTMNMPGNPEPMVMPCTETVTAVGDLWTISRFESNFMGVEFQGSGTFGYDTEKKTFVSTWVDSMTTSITNMEGTYDADTNTITNVYSAKNPATGEMINKRSTCTWQDDNITCKFYDLGDEDMLTMTIEMKRKATAIEASTEAAGSALDAIKDAKDSVNDSVEDAKDAVEDVKDAIDVE